MEQTIHSDVWAMSGWIGMYNAGILIFENGSVSFITSKGAQFNVPLTEIKNVKWPALQLGYGVNIEVNEKKYKFTFMQPNGQASLDASTYSSIGKFATGIQAIKTLSRAKQYKQVANQWRELLGG